MIYSLSRPTRMSTLVSFTKFFPTGVGMLRSLKSALAFCRYSRNSLCASTSLHYCCSLSKSINSQMSPDSAHLMRQLTSRRSSSAATDPAVKPLRTTAFHGEQHNFDVRTFGALIVRAGSVDVDLNVDAVNPETCPDQNIASVHNECGPALTVLYSDKENHLSIESSKNGESRTEEHPLKACSVNVPIKFDMDLKVKGSSSVSVQNMHNNKIVIDAELGKCYLNKIQTAMVKVRTDGGDIISDGILQGNVKLETTKKGAVMVTKPLCQLFSVTTDEGNIHITSLYSDESKFLTRAGDLHIGSAHRNIDINITECGNITIDSLDGSLRTSVSSGDVKLYICRHSGVEISVEKGDIAISLPDTLRSKIDLTGSSITIDDKLNSSGISLSKETRSEFNRSSSVSSISDAHPPKITDVSDSERSTISRATGDLRSIDDYDDNVDKKEEDVPLIRVRTSNGAVTLKAQDWISSLKLKNFSSTHT